MGAVPYPILIGTIVVVSLYLITNGQKRLAHVLREPPPARQADGVRKLQNLYVASYGDRVRPAPHGAFPGRVGCVVDEFLARLHSVDVSIQVDLDTLGSVGH